MLKTYSESLFLGGSAFNAYLEPSKTLEPFGNEDSELVLKIFLTYL
jgi:hypothetical protein